jgi:hypothetical protein
LVPALRETTKFGDGSWVCASLRPGKTPLTNLQTLLGADLSDPVGAVNNLLEVARQGVQSDAKRFLLIVDQFEEIFTVGKEKTDEFQKALISLAEAPNCFVVLTVRADFYGDLMENSPIWSDIKAHRYELTRIGKDGLRQAIVRPAQGVGEEIEPALVERLLNDAGTEPGILPFLQETLVDLWDRLERKNLPTLAYEAMVSGDQSANRSGLEVAMSRRADHALNSLKDEQKQAIARRILLAPRRSLRASIALSILP